MGVHAQQEPSRRPSTHQFNAISLVMANTCLPPSSSRLMIHRHTSVASRPRNARGMLGTVSSPIAQRAAAKRAAEAPRADAPGARHQKGAQSCFLTVARDTLRCRPFAPRHGARQSKLNVYCACVCVCVCVRACVCVRVGRPGTHTKKVAEKAFSFVVWLIFVICAVSLDTTTSLPAASTVSLWSGPCTLA